MSGHLNSTNASSKQAESQTQSQSQSLTDNHNQQQQQFSQSRNNDENDEYNACNQVFLPTTTDNEDDENHARSTLNWFEFKTQILCVNIIGISMIHAGLTITISNMLSTHFDNEAISIFASLSALTTPPGCFLIGLTADRLGRKRNLLITQIGCVITWMSVSAINDKTTLYFSAVLCGLSRGALTATCPAYISEITHSRYRQLFLGLTTTFFTSGVLIVTILNAFTTYVYSGLLLSGCFAALAISTLIAVPESPHWLAVFKLDSTSAKRNLKTLNPNQSVFDKEWRLIEEKMNEAAATAARSNRRSACARAITKLMLLTKPSVYRPCLTLFVLILFQQCSFIYPFTSYTVRCLKALAPTLEPLYSKQIFLASGVARLVVSVLTSAALTTFNQKQLLIVSAAGVGGSSLLLFILGSQTNSQMVEWASLVGFISYLLSGFVALVGVPWTIIFELLPTEAKGFFGPVMVAFGYSTMSLVLKKFPTVYDTYTTDVFLFTALVSLGAVIYVKYFILETRGKSLYEIENMYAKRTKTRSSLPD